MTPNLPTQSPAHREDAPQASGRRPAQAAVFAALLVLVSLAGCFEHPKGAAPPGETNDGPPIGASNGAPGNDSAEPSPTALPVSAWDREIVNQDCLEHYLATFGRAADRQSSLPDNYTATGPVSDLVIMAIECQTTITNNQTVVQDTVQVFMLTPVEVEAQTELAQGADFYLYAVWTTEPELTSLYTELGIERSYLAEAINITAESGIFSLEIRHAGAVELAASGLADVTSPTSASFSDPERFHFDAPSTHGST